MVCGMKMASDNFKIKEQSDKEFVTYAVASNQYYRFFFLIVGTVHETEWWLQTCVSHIGRCFGWNQGQAEVDFLSNYEQVVGKISR